MLTFVCLFSHNYRIKFDKNIKVTRIMCNILLYNKSLDVRVEKKISLIVWSTLAVQNKLKIVTISCFHFFNVWIKVIIR